ncbi:MAG: hypothetical protein RR444_02580, partial [Oscillospiraceae bacterium]
INEQQFIEMNEHFTLLKCDIQSKIDAINAQIKTSKQSMNQNKDKSKIIANSLELPVLTKTCVDELIDCIEIEAVGKKHSQHKDMKLNIYWNL